MPAFLLALLLLSFPSHALGAEAPLPAACLDVEGLLATWPWLGKLLGVLAGSMGIVHYLTRILLALPIVQKYRALVWLLRIVSALGFNKAPPQKCQVLTFKRRQRCPTKQLPR